jgi:hypothetical protein
MNTPKKKSVKNTSKETITTKSKKSTMTYNADRKGNVSTIKITPDKKIAFTTSMDTTGYAAGKPYFKHTVSTNKGISTAKVPRKDVMPRIKNMKQEVLENKKRGGAVKVTKKK